MPPKRVKAATKDASVVSAARTRNTRSRASIKDATALDTSELEIPESLTKSSGRKTRTRTSAASAKDDTVVSSGSGEDEARFRRRSRAAVQTKDAENVQGTAEAEAEAKTPPRPIQRGRRPPRTVRKVVQSEANKAAIEGLKKRMEEEAQKLKNGGINEPEAQEVEVEQAEKDATTTTVDETKAKVAPTTKQRGAPTTLQKRGPSTLQRAPNTVQRAAPGSVARPGSTVKVQSTPGVENSILALANFRRRPRQPSLLQMVQNPELVHGLGDDTTDFSLGASDDEDDFAPHDEGTPLQLDRPREQHSVTPTATAPRPEPQVISDDDESDSMYGATPLPSPGRKRKSDALEDNDISEVQIPRSQTPLSHHSGSPIFDDHDQTIPATAPTPSPNNQSQHSSIYADPVSSSPPASPTSPALSSRLPTAPSPNMTRQTRDKATSKQKPLTTATLRAMLPKRRNQRDRERSEFDMTSSSIEASSSDHEASFAATTRRRNPAPPRRQKGALSPIAKKAALYQTRTAANAAPAAAKTKKTYSRAITVSSSDKENASTSSLSELETEDSAASSPPDTSIETIKGGITESAVDAKSREIEERRKFFAEVDEWEMEFESAPSLGGGLGSSPAWR